MYLYILIGLEDALRLAVQRRPLTPQFQTGSDNLPFQDDNKHLAQFHNMIAIIASLPFTSKKEELYTLCTVPLPGLRLKTTDCRKTPLPLALVCSCLLALVLGAMFPGCKKQIESRCFDGSFALGGIGSKYRTNYLLKGPAFRV